MTRLFLAVWPPEDVVAELTALPRKDQRGVRFVSPQNWHITLRFLGEARLGDVVQAVEQVTFAACRARLAPAVDVLAARAVVVPVSGLDELAAPLIEGTRAIGDPPHKRFNGHLTVARLKHGARMPPALGMRVDVSFDVDEIALVQSRLDPEGARYETVETWPVG